MKVPTILHKNVSKGSERKSKNLVQLVIRTTKVRNTCLANVLDTDLKITKLQNVESHLKIMRNEKSKYILVKDVIEHHRKNVTTEKVSKAKRYMHLWHVCLIRENVLVGILVTVRN